MATRRKPASKPMELELVTETEVEELTEEGFEFVELTPEPEPEPEPAPVTFTVPAPKPVPAARRRNVPRFTQVK